jgi:glycosyltransferase involved in cell wall biosynthesis
MRRLLLVTHRPFDQDGGPAARWRAFARYLPEHGWQLDVLSAAGGVGAAEFDAGSSRAVAARAKTMAWLARASEPAFRRAGVQPDALPLSMLWIARGALSTRRRISELEPDVVLATGPPFAGPLAARLGVPPGVPLLVELRDLWAANPAFDAGGPLLPALEAWLLRGASRVIACTPEAVSDLRRRHPRIAERVLEIANGFDPAIRELAGAQAGREPGRPLTLLHSGTLTGARPIAPLADALADSRVAGDFRLVLHGYASPPSRAEVERAQRAGGAPIEMLAPSPWPDAIARIAAADGCVITQGRGAGDATAVASKVYEYLALGKPVVCLTDGGATEELLVRLRADRLCARLDDREGIVAALVRLRDGRFDTVEPSLLERYDRRALAGRMAAVLEEAAGDDRASRDRDPSRRPLELA